MMTFRQKEDVFTAIATQAGNTQEVACWLAEIATYFIESSDELRLTVIRKTQKMNLPDMVDLLKRLHARYDQDMRPRFIKTD